MDFPFVLCDVFADHTFAGNQLAVFTEADGIPEDQMAALAGEFGWSEITFVLPGEHPRVRIWTPSGELPFAGHPTIGTALVLAANGRIQAGWSVLELGIGPVAVEVTEVSATGGHAGMTQREPRFGPTFADRRRLASALDLDEGDLAAELPAQLVSTGLDHFLVPVTSLETLARARPVPDLLPAVIAEIGARWVYLFCTDTPGTTAAARTRLLGLHMEDPATGSAAGPCGAYLVYYGVHQPGVLTIEQGIEMGRPSRITVDVPREGGEIGAIRVSGDVRIWGRGNLLSLGGAERNQA